MKFKSYDKVFKPDEKKSDEYNEAYEKEKLRLKNMTFTEQKIKEFSEKCELSTEKGGFLHHEEGYEEMDFETDVIEDWIAQALKEQREEIKKEVEGLIGGIGKIPQSEFMDYLKLDEGDKARYQYRLAVEDILSLLEKDV